MPNNRNLLATLMGVSVAIIVMPSPDGEGVTVGDGRGENEIIPYHNPKGK